MIEINRVLMRGSKFGQDAQREAYFDSDKHLKELLNFGYEIIDDECFKKVNGSWRKYTILARVSTIPNHDKLAELENEYEALRKGKKDLPHTSTGLAILLFVLFIIPGIFYVTTKNKEKKKIKQANEEAEEKIKVILDKAWELVKKR